MSCPTPIIKVEKRAVTIVTQGRGLPGRSHSVESYKTYADLPTVGNANMLYIVEEENACYRWVPEMLRWICIGRDYTEIKEINGDIN